MVRWVHACRRVGAGLPWRQQAPMRGKKPHEEEEKTVLSTGIRGARYVGQPWLVMNLIYIHFWLMAS
jgi:hypothetical protein